MKLIQKYSKFVPYLYFITVIAFWFTDANKSLGTTAYPILLFGIPFVWQLIKPNNNLNFSLGITFVCLSSYILIAQLSDALNLVSLSYQTKHYLMYGGLLAIANFIMALWIIRNSVKKAFK